MSTLRHRVPDCGSVTPPAPLPAPDPDDPRDLRWRRAHLVTPQLLTWPAAAAPGLTFHLHYAADGGLRVVDGWLIGADVTLQLRPHPAGLPARLTDRDGYRHLGGRPVLHLDADGEVPDRWLQGQLAVTATDGTGVLVAASGVQTALLLDQRYASDAPLGVSWDTHGYPTIAVWAPTARGVHLHRTVSPAVEPWVPPTDLDDVASDGAAADGGRSDIDPAGVAGATRADRRSRTASDSGEPDEVLPLNLGAQGVWSVVGTPRWRGTAYRFEVEVYDPNEDRVVRNIVTDPWSVGLSADSRWSLVLDLDDLEDPALAPRGWAQGTRKPAFAGQARMVAYELHVSDFSAADGSVPEELRGTYRAFSLAGSHGVRHLRHLAEAGVSHLHLLPINDMASVPERRSDRRTPLFTAAPAGGPEQDTPAQDTPAQDTPAHGTSAQDTPAQADAAPVDPAIASAVSADDARAVPTTWPPDSPLPQAAQQAVADRDGYNWGYDPFHWLVPEGSYATDPDGPTRIREVRELVAAVNRLGLRVVVDVVFNHTHRAGRHPFSVLDRIVPGYYHRLDDLGRVTTSTCCPNTATEHRMMERLLTDAVLTWARAYRVDGFRFDLLGHHPAAQARRLRAALDRLTLRTDGVDGRQMVLYGEGWEFGEVAGDARFLQATQRGLAGSGIGTFDDRLRDAVRGGSHVGHRSEQGFASGLWWEPNGSLELTDGERDAQRVAALDLNERVMLGVGGNLAELPVPCADGRIRLGRDIAYGGASAGYARRPQDQVAYVSAHDNETLFDALAAKLPIATSMEDRIRMQVVALATAILGQGTPFLHAGCELLRSKSLDRDTYRSGPLINAIDWSAKTTRWGVGIPPVASNPDERPLLSHLLRSIPRPEPAHIAGCRDRVLELLRIRASSPLFGLPTAEDVLRVLRFRLTGPAAIPGVVAWSLQGSSGWADHDLLLTLNATPRDLHTELGEEPHELRLGRRPGRWKLHPLLTRSRDPVNHLSHIEGGVLHVPARTVAVFLREATG